MSEIEYRGYKIAEREFPDNGGSVLRYQPIAPNGDELDWFCRSIVDAKDVIDSHLRRAELMAQAIADEALARAMAPVVTNARKLGRCALDAHPLV